ncbi:hypothetical protein [Streptomyces sp. TUS-ST3]|uniref:hypothetical protein n=1 Tax=Streptomyces sp. TUS-ST3 TaxID=3025591 RepID=UPI0024E1318C|nr:hypothetical protein [Streptomyces sp. TUS-ST3]
MNQPQHCPGGSVMPWTTSIACGGLGGLVVEIVVFYGRIATWQAARHRALAKDRRRDQLPSLGKYIDAPSDALAAVTRLTLGAGAGWIFSPQLTGVFAAVAVGASAPALLRQLGSAKTLQAALSGSNSTASAVEPSQHSSLSSGEAEVQP